MTRRYVPVPTMGMVRPQGHLEPGRHYYWRHLRQQNDYGKFAEAIRSGRLEVREGL